jgi:hypothetical protein
MHELAACAVGQPPRSSFTGQAPMPRWPTFHLRYLRPRKAPRDVRHAKSHFLERPRRMVALRIRGKNKTEFVIIQNSYQICERLLLNTYEKHALECSCATLKMNIIHRSCRL